MMKAIVYTTPSCPGCVMAKEFLASHGVSYQEINVAEDRAAAFEMVQKSGQRGVPVVELNGEIIVGFAKMRMERILAGVAV